VSRSQFNFRLPADEKEELRADARRYGISMAALVRINNLFGREHGERAELNRRAFPQKVSDP
jgi:hypothetical protein